MPTKKEELEALAGAVIDVSAGEVPSAAKWNQPRDAVQAALPRIGDFFTDTDGRLGALEARFGADHDPATGKNPIPDEWAPDAATPTYVNASTFTLPGNRTSDYAIADRVRATLGAAQVRAGIQAVSFASGVTTVVLDETVLTAGLTAVARGLVRRSAPKVQTADLVQGAASSRRLQAVGPPGQTFAINVDTLHVSLAVPAGRGGPGMVQATVALSMGAGSAYRVELRQRIDAGAAVVLDDDLPQLGGGAAGSSWLRCCLQALLDPIPPTSVRTLEVVVRLTSGSLGIARFGRLRFLELA